MKKTNRIVAMFICIAMFVSMVPTTLAEEIALNLQQDVVVQNVQDHPECEIVIEENAEPVFSEELPSEAPPTFDFDEEGIVEEEIVEEEVAEEELVEEEFIEEELIEEEIIEEEIIEEELVEEEIVEEEIVEEELVKEEIVEEEIAEEELIEEEIVEEELVKEEFAKEELIEEEIVEEELVEEQIIEEEIVEEELVEEEIVEEPVVLMARRVVDTVTCEHQWQNFDVLNVYESTNGEYHTLVAQTVAHQCLNCKEYYEDVYDVNNKTTSKHNFSAKGVCYECGYEKEYEEEYEEEHEHDWKEYDIESYYEVVDSKYHVLTNQVQDKKCKECGERETDEYTVKNPQNEEHYFDNGKCYVCGYVYEEETTDEAEPIIEVTPTPAPEATEAPTVEPTIEVTPEPTEEPVEEIHEHNWKEYDIANHYEVVDSKYHVLTMQWIDKQCKDCEEWARDEYPAKNPQNEEHYFDNGKCYVCGYVYEEEANDEAEPVIEVTPTPAPEATEAPTVEPIIEITPEPTEMPIVESTPEPIVEVHEHKWREKYNMEYHYDAIDNYTHKLVAYQFWYYCTGCDEEREEMQVADGTSELHVFDDNNECMYCHYKFEIPEEKVEEIVPQETLSPEVIQKHIHTNNDGITKWWYSEYWSNGNKEVHYQNGQKFYYCDECGEVVKLENEIFADEHDDADDDGKCDYCGDAMREVKKELDKITELEIQIMTETVTLWRLKNFVETQYTNHRINDEDYRYYSSLIHIYDGWLTHLDDGYVSPDEYESWTKSTPLVELYNSLNNAESYLDVCLKIDKNGNLKITKDNTYTYVQKSINQAAQGDFYTGDKTIVGYIGFGVLQIIPGVGTICDIRDLCAAIYNQKIGSGAKHDIAINTVALLPLGDLLKWSKDGILASKLASTVGEETAEAFMKTSNEFIESAAKLSDDAVDSTTVVVKKVGSNVDEVPIVGIVTQSADEAVEVTSDVGKYVDEVFDFPKSAKQELADIAKMGINNVDDIVETCTQSQKKIFSKEFLEHVFYGNKSGGLHYNGLDGAGKITSILTPPNEFGVYRATVEIAGKAKKTPSTFFPNDWTLDEVLDAIEEVYYTGEKLDIANVSLKGTCSAGFDITIYFDGAMNIISAFPNM